MRRVGLTVCDLIALCTIIELLEVASADHLNPVKKVLRRGATDVVAAHHWEGAEVEMVHFIEADDGLDDIPDEAGEVVENRCGPVCEARQVEQGIEAVVEEVRHFKKVQEGSENTLLVVDIHNRSHANEGLEILGKVLIKSVSDEPLSSTLGMPKPDDLREVSLSMVKYIFDIGGNIILAHLIHCEIPVSFILRS